MATAPTLMADALPNGRIVQRPGQQCWRIRPTDLIIFHRSLGITHRAPTRADRYAR